MTDKEIIIDGVDVSGCDYFKNNGKCRISHYQQNIKYTCCNCSEWNCYYKQLKRKERALDKLIPILEYYATSTIGRKQVDGTYKCVCSTNKFGNECLNYDPRLAIEGLNTINKAKEIKR